MYQELLNPPFFCLKIMKVRSAGCLRLICIVVAIGWGRLRVDLLNVLFCHASYFGAVGTKVRSGPKVGKWRSPYKLLNEFTNE